MKKFLKALLIALVVSLSLGVITACKKTEEPKKTKLDAPVIASKVYTGSKQTATVPENEGYTVEANLGGTDVGEYDVVLTLSDKKKYEWTTPNADDKTKLTLKFAITKANNEITALTLADWTYGEEPNAPAATAKFGTAVFTYSASENGEYTATVPTAVGSYFVKATVAGTANYGEATKTARFEIKKAAALVATAPTAKTLTYTGAAQELLTAGTANGGELRYKLGEDGDWGATIPAATNAGEYKVYYKVVGDESHSDTAEQELTVTIAKAAATVTAPTAKTLTYTGAVQELLTAGTANGGELRYKLGEDGEWGTAIPTATNAGEYKVYYKVVGDANHTDLTGDDLYVAVTVAKANADFATTPAAVSALVYNGNAQTLATAGTANGGTIKYSLDNTNWSETLPTATNAGEYTVYYVITPDANHNAAAAESFKVTIAKAENNVTFSLGDLEIHCDSAIPTEFDATATAGTITYTYSSDNSAFYTAEELKNMSFKFEAGKTYYVKATAAESENYLSANKVAQITATHNHTSETTDENGLTVLTCACGHKQVNGELNAAKTVNFAATVTEGAVSATAGELDISAVYGENSSATITVDKQEYANLGIVNGKITLKGVIPVTVYGQKAVGVKFSAADGDYNFTVNILFVTKQITTVDELKSVKAVSDALDRNGYYMLANDIKFGSNEYWYDGSAGYSLGGSDWKTPFLGTFDGAGYKIDNLAFYHNWNGEGVAFIQILGRTGVLKNVAFTNFNGENKNSIVKKCYNGTVENVYVQYTAKANNQTYAGTFNEDANGVINLKNVVLDFSKATINNFTNDNVKGRAMFLGYAKVGSTFENVVVFGLESKFNNNVIKFDGNTSIDGICVYNSDTHTANKEAPASGWDTEFWSSANGGIPTFKGMTAYDKSSAFTKSATKIEAGANAEFAVSDYCLLYLGEDAKGIATLENGVVTVAEDATVGATFTVYSKNIFDTENATELTVTVLKKSVKYTVETITEIDLNATASGGTVTAGAVDKTIDLTSVYNGTAEAGLSIGDTDLGSADITNGVLTLNAIPVTVYGNVNLTVMIVGDTVDTVITVPLFVVTKTIKTTAELQGLKNYTDNATMQGGGYYRLGANINAGIWYLRELTNKDTGAVTQQAVDYRIGTQYAFKGTLDGCGYALEADLLTTWQAVRLRIYRLLTLRCRPGADLPMKAAVRLRTYT